MMNSPQYRTSVFAAAASVCFLASGCSQSATGLATTPVANTPRTTAADTLVTGVSSCASSGCHGKPFNGSQRDWQTAYHIWATEDPHRHAFEVLYTQRSIEIVQNLTRALAKKPDHSAALHKFCVGCHATASDGLGELQMGVSCESCHGKAGGWLNKHYLLSWPQDRDSVADFNDTTNLSIRAAVCTGCHIGPMPGPDGAVHDVNHDLIAAGHPRLVFELDAYLTNYPKHWSTAKDAARHAGAFHVNAWAAGQEQAARRLNWQIDWRSSQPERWPDFANFECFDCHHAIRAPKEPRAQAASKRGGLPRPALAPLPQLLAEPMQAQQQAYTRLLRKSWSEPGQTAAVAPFEIRVAQQFEPIRARDLPAHAKSLLSVPVAWKDEAEGGPTWDQAVQFYLAIEALARDLDNAAGQSLASAAKDLSAELLSHGFDLSPTQYDSPSHFDPAAFNRSDALQQVETALEAIASQPSN